MSGVLFEPTKQLLVYTPKLFIHVLNFCAILFMRKGHFAKKAKIKLPLKFVGSQ